MSSLINSSDVVMRGGVFGARLDMTIRDSILGTGTIWDFTDLFFLPTLSVFEFINISLHACIKEKSNL
jgi:hypothetical protein